MIIIETCLLIQALQQDSSKYCISSPSKHSDVITGANYRDSNEDMFNAEQKNASSVESTPLQVEEHKDNTFSFGLGQGDSKIKHEQGMTEEISMPDRSDMIKDAIPIPASNDLASPKNMQQEINSIMGDYTGFCPSAVPTPLMGNHPAGVVNQPPPLPPLPPALPSASLTVSDRPDPQSIITHFDIVHHHMERSAVTLHQSLAASMDIMMGNIMGKIDESVQITKSNGGQRAKNIKNVAVEVEGLKRTIEELATKLNEANKATLKALSDKLQTIVIANAKTSKTVEAIAGKVGELEKKLESTQASQQEGQLQVQRELRQLQHLQRADTPLENNRLVSTSNNGSAQATMQRSPTHASPTRTAASASVTTTSAAPPFSSVPATISWPGYDYSYSYNYTAPPAFPLSRQQLQQMDPQSRRAYVTNHAMQLATPDISQHPAFAGSGVSGGNGSANGANSGYYEHGYGYGSR